MDSVRIGNAQGFWGDDPDAPRRLVEQVPDIDYLTLDYLAEVSMSILAGQRQKDPALGYARDFVAVFGSLAPRWLDGSCPCVVTNAGGLNPSGCAGAYAEALREAKVAGMRIGVVDGDDVLPAIRRALDEDPGTRHFANAETGQSISTIAGRIVTANAYLGAAPIVAALKHRASIVITGRVADPSLTVGPCANHFAWSDQDYHALAGATVAGHLIECGTQVTGGISTDWMDVPRPGEIGFPIVEVSRDGSCVVTKPAGTGGRVDECTVKEQLLYEIGDPDKYLSPDVTASFLGLRVEDLGDDRVRVAGARGRGRPDSYKVTLTYRAGYRASASLTIVGHRAVAKARRAGQVVRDRLAASGAAPAQFLAECLGAGDACPALPARDDLTEVVLRLTAADESREVIERFSRQIVPLVTAGPQGTTGYFDARPQVREVFGYWPCLIDRALVHPRVQFLEVP